MPTGVEIFAKNHTRATGLLFFFPLLKAIYYYYVPAITYASFLVSAQAPHKCNQPTKVTTLYHSRCHGENGAEEQGGPYEAPETSSLSRPVGCRDSGKQRLGKLCSAPRPLKRRGAEMNARRAKQGIERYAREPNSNK
jgi:hypothetical protein